MSDKDGGEFADVDTSPRRLRVAMALHSDLDHDSRVLREAASLAAVGLDVTIYCRSYEGSQDLPFRVVVSEPDLPSGVVDVANPYQRTTRQSRLWRLASRVGWMARYLRDLRAWGRWAVSSAGAVDVWHAHDLPGLMAVGPRVKAPCELVYDSHEIFLEAGTAVRMPAMVRRLLAKYERRLVRRVVALVTVNEAYAAVLERRLQPRRIVLVRNCPPRWSPDHEAHARLRAATAIPRTCPLVLYHGALSPNRGIEQLAAALDEPGMADVHLVLLGFGDVERLGIDPQGLGPARRVHLLEAVSPDELLGWVAGADVDAIALQHSSLNHWLCTPNKLWESLAAGVPVVVSDFPVMRKIVLSGPSGPLGAVCDPVDPASIAVAIRSIIDQSAEEQRVLRQRCLDAAHDRWNWETESTRLIELYDSLIPETASP
jgi:glycosyltransferase involved in cell wall biosynthesis